MECFWGPIIFFIIQRVSLNLHLCIYIFFYSLTVLSFPMWELRGSPSSSLSFWLWIPFCQLSHHFSLNWNKKFSFVCSQVTTPCPAMLGSRFQRLDWSILYLVSLMHVFPFLFLCFPIPCSPGGQTHCSWSSCQALSIPRTLPWISQDSAWHTVAVQ